MYTNPLMKSQNSHKMVDNGTSQTFNPNSKKINILHKKRP